MNAKERYVELLRSMPMIKSDFGADGNLTEEAAKRVSDWAWEQLSEAERKEFEEQCRTEQADEIYERLIAEGKAEEFIGPDGQERIRFL